MKRVSTKLIAFLPLRSLLAILLVAISVQSVSSGTEATDLKKLQSEVQSVAERAVRATVCVLSGAGSGSGVIVSEDGYVLTASHVVASARADNDVRLILSDGQQISATALGFNRTRDAAILKITKPGPWPFLPMGRSSKLELGEWVVALGHPGGYEPGRSPPVRLGKVLTKTDGPFGVITDCTLIGGDSGGPLFNLKGEVVGIHSSIAASTAQNRHVPIDVYHRDWKILETKRRWGRLGQLIIPKGAGYLGLVAELEVDSEGLHVVEVESGRAAEKAGIKVGDILISIDGYELVNPFSLVETVVGRKADETVELKLTRKGKSKTINVKLDSREPEENTGDKKPEGDGDDDEKDGDKDDDETPPSAVPNDLREFFRPFEEMARGIGRAGRGKRIPWDALLPNSYFSQNAGQEPKGRPPSIFEKDHNSVTDAFVGVTKRAALSTVQLLGNEKPVALGVIVDRAGHVLTKASELKGELTIKYANGQVATCDVIGVHEAHDLALLKPKSGQPTGGMPAAWKTDTGPPGSLLATPAPDGSIIATGVISVPSRKPFVPRAFLGIAPEQKSDEIVIVQVVKGSAAEKCGLKLGDVLIKIGGQSIETINDVFTSIANLEPGQEIEIIYRRDDKEETGKAVLGTRAVSSERMGRFESMNQMSGPRSKKREGFPFVLQHDTEVPPIACGGPLVDLEGKVVGINIARSGRVESMAIPTATIHEVVAEMKAGKLPPPEGFGHNTEETETEIREIRTRIRRLQRRLKLLEGRRNQ